MDNSAIFEPNLNILLQIFGALEVGDFAHAEQYCNKLLEDDPENVYAHLAKLMSERKVRAEHDLVYQQTPLEESRSYKWILRFADDELKRRIEAYNLCTTNNKNGQTCDIPPRTANEISSVSFQPVQKAHEVEETLDIDNTLKQNSKSRIVLLAAAALLELVVLFVLLDNPKEEVAEKIVTAEQVASTVEKETSNESTPTQLPEPAQLSDGLQKDARKFEHLYQKPVYDSFNSPASENGLADTLIYLDGVLDSDANYVNSSLSYSRFLDEDNNLWILGWYPDETNVLPEKGEYIKAYGIYTGLATAFDALPFVIVTRYNSGNSLYTMTAQGLPLYFNYENLSVDEAQEIAKGAGITKIGGFTYIAPVSWRTERKNDNVNYHYFTDINSDGFLFVQREGISFDGERDEETPYKKLYEVADGIKSHLNVSDFSSEEIMVGERYALKTQHCQTIEGRDYYCTGVILIDYNETISFMIVEPDTSKGGMVSEFEAIIESIEKY